MAVGATTEQTAFVNINHLFFDEMSSGNPVLGADGRAIDENVYESDTLETLSTQRIHQPPEFVQAIEQMPDKTREQAMANAPQLEEDLSEPGTFIGETDTLDSEAVGASSFRVKESEETPETVEITQRYLSSTTFTPRMFKKTMLMSPFIGALEGIREQLASIKQQMRIDSKFKVNHVLNFIVHRGKNMTKQALERLVGLYKRNMDHYREQGLGIGKLVNVLISDQDIKGTQAYDSKHAFDGSGEAAIHQIKPGQTDTRTVTDSVLQVMQDLINFNTASDLA